jgi:hypothetical protein
MEPRPRRLSSDQPLAAPGTYDEKYYRYSVLRTLEDGYGIFRWRRARPGR